MSRLVLAVAVLMCSASCHESVPPPPTGAGSGEGEAAPFVQTAHDALVGQPAPAVTLQLLDGSRVELASLLGKKPIYLKFWATWCVPCREQMPHLESTFHINGDKLAMFAVDVAIDDPIENVKNFVADRHLTVPVAIDTDGSVAEQFHLNVTPQHVLIDRTGVIRYVGHAVTPELERALVAILESSTAAPVAAAVPPPTAPGPLPALALDNGKAFDFASRPKQPLALTFATLFCDSYIAESRPEIGKTCAAHAHAIEEAHRAHPELTWITVAFPVWTSDEDIRDYRKRLGATLPIGIDRGNAWFRRFGVRDTYTTLLFDSRGTELGRVEGDGSALAALIAKAQ
ncbi:MAG: TlpA disulfide reductase family protein [Deltaproteobacteria bacterium]